MTRWRFTTITACGFVLAGACTTANGAWHVAPPEATVIAQVVAACRVHVPDRLSSTTAPTTAVVVRCTRDAPHSARMVATPDTRRDANAPARPVARVLVSF